MQKLIGYGLLASIAYIAIRRYTKLSPVEALLIPGIPPL